jgi:hypothetical protein
VKQGCRVQKDFKVQRVHKEFKEFRVKQAQQAHRV